DTARASYNRDLLNVYTARRAAAQARNQLNNPEDLRTQVLGAEEHYAQAALAYRRALTPAGATPTTPEGVRLPPDTTVVDTEIISAKAEVANAESDVQRLAILAPMDGTVTEWTAKAGENIQAGQSLGSVVDLKQLTVTVEVSPQLVPYMLTGSHMRVTMQGPSHQEYDGKVVAVSPTLDPQTNKQKVEIAVYDKEEKLSPGADVIVEPASK
nr:HlyD family secretion protein [Armatimonadota bacterium]